MSTTHVVDLELGFEEGRDLQTTDKAEIAKAMDPELKKFNQWFQSIGNQPLTPMEKSILKTYLAWKLIYEEARVDPQT